jgi:hypothetical protein
MDTYRGPGIADTWIRDYLRSQMKALFTNPAAFRDRDSESTDSVVDIIFDSIFEFLYDESYTSRPKNHDIPEPDDDNFPAQPETEPEPEPEPEPVEEPEPEAVQEQESEAVAEPEEAVEEPGPVHLISEDLAHTGRSELEIKPIEPCSTAMWPSVPGETNPISSRRRRTRRRRRRKRRLVMSGKLPPIQLVVGILGRLVQRLHLVFKALDDGARSRRYSTAII